MPPDRNPPRPPLRPGYLAGDERDVLRPAPKLRTPVLGNKIPHVPVEPGHVPLARPANVRAQTAQPVVELPDEVTGQHAGVELAQLRSRRPTNERIGRLEAKHDRLDDRFRDLDNRMSNQDGQLETLVRFSTDAAADRAERRRWLLLFVKALGAAAAVVIGALAAAGLLK